jgi:hypothetical protein
VKECIKSLAVSEDIDISLVMGHLPPMMAKTGLGKEEAKDLQTKWKNLKCYLWKNEEGRFHHLKLYRFNTDKGIVSAIGSCNFSRPGLFWNLGENDEGVKALGNGNVESMMLDWNEGIDWSTQIAKDSDFDDISTKDEAPKPWPFYLAVFYDWKSCEYAWSIKGNFGSQRVRLKLSEFEIYIDEASTEGKKSGKLTSSLYTVESEQFEPMVGSVIELNLDNSTREYSTPLESELILQSWLQGAVNEPVPAPDIEDEDEDAQGNTKDNGLTPNDEKSPVFFEFFDFYRATAAFETKLHSCVNEEELLDLCVWRSDSAWALGSAILKSKQSAAVKYLVLSECVRIMKPSLGKKKLQPFIKQLQEKVNECRVAVKQAFAKELINKGQPIDPEVLLSWYEQQFRSAAV